MRKLALILFTTGLMANIDHAYDFCEEHNHWKQECYELLEDAYYVQVDALNVCRLEGSDTFKNDCLRPIVNRQFNRGEVASCQNELTNHRGDCFASKGQRAPEYQTPSPRPQTQVIIIKEQERRPPIRERRKVRRCEELSQDLDFSVGGIDLGIGMSIEDCTNN